MSCHIFGGAHPDVYDPTFKLGGDFCTLHLPRKFHHPTFTHSEVIVLTNKQTHKQSPLKTFNTLRYIMTLLCVEWNVKAYSHIPSMTYSSNIDRHQCSSL